MIGPIFQNASSDGVHNESIGQRAHRCQFRFEAVIDDNIRMGLIVNDNASVFLPILVAFLRIQKSTHHDVADQTSSSRYFLPHEEA